MKTIVECGATKADWRLVENDGTLVERILTTGINVSTMKDEDVKETVSGTLATLHDRGFLPDAFFLYTAGVLTPSIEKQLKEYFHEACPHAHIEVQTDLVGSARAVCGHHAGIAAILGTGSNSCFYDGEQITEHINSGGYIIGDEGSAASLGRLFVADLIKGLVPTDIVKEFEKHHDISYEALVGKIYGSPSPSGYLGSLAPYIYPYYEHPYIKKLVDTNFEAFITRSLLRYDVAHHPVGIVGGFGNACQHIFTPIARSYGITISGYFAHPIERLIDYHCEKFIQR